jgi:hypothetical protein
MMFRAASSLGFAFFVAIPAAAIVMLTHPYWLGLRLDTSQQNTSRVKAGMTFTEADAILGGPPGEYRINPHSEFKFVCGCMPHYESWATSEGVVDVHYGCDGQIPGEKRVSALPRHERKITAVEWAEDKSTHPHVYIGTLAIAWAVTLLVLNRVWNSRQPVRHTEPDAQAKG